MQLTNPPAGRTPLARIRAAAAPMPHLAAWRSCLRRRYSPPAAAQIGRSAQEHYRLLKAGCPPPATPALRRPLYRQALPALALYRALQSHDPNHEAVLAAMDECLGLTFRAARRFTAGLRLLPRPFGLFRRMMLNVMRSFPEAGWCTEWLENSSQALAFVTTRCFYLDVLTQLGAPELTPAFCRTDDLLAAAFPPSIRFVRRGTLAAGAPACDFRYDNRR